MAEPASKDSSGHYFEPSPSSRSAPQEIRLDLPDLSLTLATDRGVFSPDRIDTGTKHLLLDGPAPAAERHVGRPRLRLRRRSRARSPGARPAATVWAVDVNERALELCRANAERLGLAQRARRSPRTRCRRTWSSTSCGRTRPSASARPRCTSCSALARPAGARRSGRCSSCRSTSAPTRSTAGWRRRAGRSTDAARGRATACSRCARGEAARRHRHEAAAPRVAAPHRRVASALVLDDVQGPFNVGAIIRTAAAFRVDDVWLAGHTPDPDDAKVGKTALGTQRYLTFHRADTTIAAIDAARAAGYRVVGLELADGAAPAARARRRPTRPASSSGTRTAGAARPRWRPATRSPSCRCSARWGRSTSPPPRPSRSTSSAASTGRPSDPTTPTARGGPADVASRPWWSQSYAPLRDDELVAAARIVQPRHARLGHRRGERGVGVARSTPSARWAPSPRPASWSASPATSTPISAVPGGADVPAGGVTAVGVVSHHRRQGHLTRLMETQLRTMADRGTAVGLLVAAEWPIYGRFGYGPAIDACGFDIDARTARFLAEPTGHHRGGDARASCARSSSASTSCGGAAPPARSPGTAEVWDAYRRRAGVARAPARSGPAPRRAVARRRGRGPGRRRLQGRATTGSGTGRPARPRSPCSSAPRPRPSASSGGTCARSTGSPPSRPATAASTTRSS